MIILELRVKKLSAEIFDKERSRLVVRGEDVAGEVWVVYVEQSGMTAPDVLFDLGGAVWVRLRLLGYSSRGRSNHAMGQNLVKIEGVEKGIECVKAGV